jgi:uncharacterized protein YceH (UPF0502 family)
MQYRSIHFSSPSDDPQEQKERTGDIVLDGVEVRVLGCLLEKESTTPDYYPLTLNSLVSACNQKTSRDPVVSYTEGTVQTGLEGLQTKGLVHRVTTSDGRVPRYRHVFLGAYGINRAQGAALCILMLRGPQTEGEIRQRSGRLYEFASLQEVEETLQSLMAPQPRPLVAKLERQAGTKEPRYVHLFSGEVAYAPAAPAEVSGPAEATEQRIAGLEEEVERLQQRVENLEAQLAEFRKQFE